MVESRQGTSRLKSRREKSILGGRIKTAEENHWPKNKAGENDWRDASRQHGNRSERETRIRPAGLPSDENLTMKKRKGWHRNPRSARPALEQELTPERRAKTEQLDLNQKSIMKSKPERTCSWLTHRLTRLNKKIG
jgi:hypothetical protein